MDEVVVIPFDLAASRRVERLHERLVAAGESLVLVAEEDVILGGERDEEAEEA
ncbi:hypothetical protein [Kitasatospora purpeofusca]|uniref:hypothetical protein n=1 Tax=Kitasatospora purpeofusca TaxID=67352 RepID=UPI0036664DF1